MIKYWEKLPEQRTSVISIDPAYSEDKHADFKVASLISIDENGRRYLECYIRNHKPTGEFIDEILNLYMQNKERITSVGLPVGGGDKEFFSSFCSKCRDRQLALPIVELKNTFTTSSGMIKRKKANRITAALQPQFEQGRYFIHESHIEARDEILSYKTSRWDDLVDTLAYAEQILQQDFEIDEGPQYDRYGQEIIDEGGFGYWDDNMY